jgi:hypothetical protein
MWSCIEDIGVGHVDDPSNVSSRHTPGRKRVYGLSAGEACLKPFRLAAYLRAYSDDEFFLEDGSAKSIAQLVVATEILQLLHTLHNVAMM